MSIYLASSNAAGSDTLPVYGDGEDGPESDTDSSYRTPFSDLSKWRDRPNLGSAYEGDPESPSATGSSMQDSGIDGEDYTHIRMDSPPPLDETLANIKDERRYRVLLQHEFHPSRTFIPTSARR